MSVPFVLVLVLEAHCAKSLVPYLRGLPPFENEYEYEYEYEMNSVLLMPAQRIDSPFAIQVLL